MNRKSWTRLMGCMFGVVAIFSLVSQNALAKEKFAEAKDKIKFWHSVSHYSPVYYKTRVDAFSLANTKAAKLAALRSFRTEMSNWRTAIADKEALKLAKYFDTKTTREDVGMDKFLETKISRLDAEIAKLDRMSEESAAKYEATDFKSAVREAADEKFSWEQRAQKRSQAEIKDKKVTEREVVERAKVLFAESMPARGKVHALPKEKAPVPEIDPGKTHLVAERTYDGSRNVVDGVMNKWIDRAVQMKAEVKKGLAAEGEATAALVKLDAILDLTTPKGVARSLRILGNFDSIIDHMGDCNNRLRRRIMELEAEGKQDLADALKMDLLEQVKEFMKAVIRNAGKGELADSSFKPLLDILMDIKTGISENKDISSELRALAGMFRIGALDKDLYKVAQELRMREGHFLYGKTDAQIKAWVHQKTREWTELPADFRDAVRTVRGERTEAFRKWVEEGKVDEKYASRRNSEIFNRLCERCSWLACAA